MGIYTNTYIVYGVIIDNYDYNVDPEEVLPDYLELLPYGYDSNQRILILKSSNIQMNSKEIEEYDYIYKLPKDDPKEAWQLRSFVFGESFKKLNIGSPRTNSEQVIDVGWYVVVWLS